MSEGLESDRIFYTLSDDQGPLRFERFEIRGPGGEPSRVDPYLEHLMGRPLSHIDIDAMRQDPRLSQCPYRDAVANTVRDLQQLFADTQKDRNTGKRRPS